MPARSDKKPWGSAPRHARYLLAQHFTIPNRTVFIRFFRTSGRPRWRGRFVSCRYHSRRRRRRRIMSHDDVSLCCYRVALVVRIGHTELVHETRALRFFIQCFFYVLRSFFFFTGRPPFLVVNWSISHWLMIAVCFYHVETISTPTCAWVWCTIVGSTSATRRRSVSARSVRFLCRKFASVSRFPTSCSPPPLLSTLDAKWRAVFDVWLPSIVCWFFFIFLLLFSKIVFFSFLCFPFFRPFHVLSQWTVRECYATSCADVDLRGSHVGRRRFGHRIRPMSCPKAGSHGFRFGPKPEGMGKRQTAQHIAVGPGRPGCSSHSW